MGSLLPRALSPFPNIVGPVSPVDYRRSPGPPQQCTMAKAPQVENDDQINRIMDNIRRCDSEGALCRDFPSSTAISTQPLPFDILQLLPPSSAILTSSLIRSIDGVGPTLAFSTLNWCALHLRARSSLHASHRIEGPRDSISTEERQLQFTQMSSMDDAKLAA